MSKKVSINLNNYNFDFHSLLYATSNLSALAVFNLINALNLDIPIGKKTNDRSEFYNVELKVGEISYYGELTIFGFLLHLKN